MKRVWIGIIVFILYIALVVLLGFALHFEGVKLLLLCLILGLLGAAAIAVVIWYLAKMAGGPVDAGAADTPEAVNLKALLHDADARIRTGHTGAKSLAAMPLIYVVGSENSAKTQTVMQSGLEPELLAGQVYQDGNVAPTQLANLWLAGSYVLVEAGGPLLRQAALWLRLVKSTLPARLGSAFSKDSRLPSRSVVVCVSIERILAPNTAEQIRALAQNINERLRQLAQTLGTSLPVYVLFTKLDTVAPFAEYAGNLTEEEVKLPIGSLLASINPNSGLYADQASEQIGSRLDQLIYALAEYRLDLLSRGGELQSLSRAYEFPRDLRKLRAGLIGFLLELGRPSQLGVNPFLRGFFFTGMRAHVVEDVLDIGPAQHQQQAAPTADAGATRIFSMAGAQSMQAPPPRQRSGGTRKVPQWVFLPHLFSKILLADKSALETSRASTRTNFLKRALLATASAFVLLILLFTTISFFNNRALEQRVSGAIRIPVAPVSATGFAATQDLATLDKLRTVLVELEDYRQNGAPLMDRFGLYKGNALYPVACQAYSDRFRSLLLAPTQNNILARLRAVQAPPLPDANYNATYKPLKAYLITTSNPDKSTVDFLPAVLASEWAGNNTPDPELARLAQAQFEFYAGLLPQPGSCLASAGGAADAQAVARGRYYLNGFQGFQHVYQSMLADASHKNPSLRYNDKFPGSAQYIIDSYEVQGAFTKGGFTFMQNAIQHPEPYFSGEEWVLGPASGPPIDRATLSAKLQEVYTADYLQNWRTYLTSAHFVAFKNLPDAATKLSILDSNVSPILELFSLVSFNTGVAAPAISGAFQAPQSVVPASNPDNVFVAQSNQAYIQKLQDLGGAVKSLTDNPLAAADPNSATPIINSAINAEQSAENIRNTFVPDPTGNMDKTSFALLEAPIKSVEDLASRAPAAALNGGGQGFCDQIGPVLKKFPFNPQADQEATTEEAAQLFAPGQGKFAQYYSSNQSLQKLIVLQGSQYVSAPGSKVPINGAYLKFLNDAQKISSSLFAAGNQPSLNFTLAEVKGAGAADGVLNIDGQQIASAGQSATFHWVSQPSSKITLATSKNTAPNMSGAWSVFRLAFGAAHLPPNRLKFTFQFNNQAPEVVLFDASGPGAPLLDPQFMKGFHCVAAVTH